MSSRNQPNYPADQPEGIWADVVCNIFENGGTNPLEGGAFVVQIAQKMRKSQASDVNWKMIK